MPPRRPPKLPTAPRIVTAYHGCSRESAERIVSQQAFLPSTRTYDWLGEGIYFWEYAPYRALEWATLKCKREGGEPAVLQATIKLGRCLNLLDIEAMTGLADVYASIAKDENVGETELLRNTEQGAHYLDRAVIDTYCRRAATSKSIVVLQTVRGSFPEGKPIYPGSKILSRTHTQIAVRDSSCITKVSLVQYS